MISFQQPDKLFLLLLLIPFLLIIRHNCRKKLRRMESPYNKSITDLISTKFTKISKIFLNWDYLYLLPLFFLLLSFSRPLKLFEITGPSKEGIDLLITLDISGSMAALDFQPSNRLQVAKKVISRFIQQRKQDRIGLVCFAANAITRSPITYDHQIVQQVLEQANIGDLEDGTAIGTAIVTSVNRLRLSERKSKVLILLTDGINNRGEFHPLDAAKIAADCGIKIYTIGVGTSGEAPYPILDEKGLQRFLMVKVEIDEVMLKKISNLTGGLYFRATDSAALGKIMNEIDQMEKTPLRGKGSFRHQELFSQLILSGFLLAVLIYLAEKIFLRTLP